MSLDDLIAKWESTAKYHRKCFMQTSSHDAEILHTAKAEAAEEIVGDLRMTRDAQRGWT